MTSKRSIESELSDLSDQVLGDLEANERVRLIIKADAAGNDDRVERLVESCPTAEYRRPDHRYTNRALVAHNEAQNAMYNLRTTWLELQWVQSQLTHIGMMDLFDLYPTDIVEDPPDGIDFPDAEERLARFRRRENGLLVTLFIHYHVYQRFAEDCIGVKFTEFLEFAAIDWDVDAIKETLSMHEATIQEIDEEAIDHSGDDVSIEDIVDEEYGQLAQDWADAADPHTWDS